MTDGMVQELVLNILLIFMCLIITQSDGFELTILKTNRQLTASHCRDGRDGTEKQTVNLEIGLNSSLAGGLNSTSAQIVRELEGRAFSWALHHAFSFGQI